MEQSLLVAIVAGAGGMLGWGLADFFAKKTIDEIGDVTSLVLAHLTGSIGFLALVAGHTLATRMPFDLPHDPTAWAGVIFFGVLQAAVYLLVYRGFGKGQLAVLNPLFASFSGITALLSVLVLGEVVTGHLVVALVTVFMGILLLNLDPAAMRERRVGFLRVPGFWEIAGATALAALWTLLWSEFVRGRDATTYSALMYLVMTVALVIYALATRTSLSARRPMVWTYLALIGLCEVVAYLAISWGYARTNHTSVVALLSGAFSLPTILLARAFLKERTTGLQFAASVVIIVGIAVLNF